MNAPAVIGHNNPPDPIDEICAGYEATREEAENWLDGSPVETEDQMKAVDALRKAARDWRMALETGQKSEAAPLHDAWKAALARWKPTIEDAQRIEKGLVALVDAFKRKLAAEKEAAERAARAEAARKAREAAEAARLADAASIEAMRAAAEAQREAEEAQARAAAAAKDTVTGLRTFTTYRVIDGTAFARWLWQNDKPALTEFMDEYARKRKLHIPGVVEAVTERRAV